MPCERPGTLLLVMGGHPESGFGVTQDSRAQWALLRFLVASWM